MKFLLKYATRSRPALFMQTITAWSAKASGKHPLQWLISIDADDETMQTPDIQAFIKKHKLPVHVGNSTTKIEAMNADLQRAKPWDVLMLISDDQEPLKDDWDAYLAGLFAPTLDMAVWFPDGRQRRLCTMSIFGRPVLDRIGGNIYHPAFESVYADNLYQDILEHAGRMMFVDDEAFVRHAWREENNDALMNRNEHKRVYDRDRETYTRLKRSMRLPNVK